MRFVPPGQVDVAAAALDRGELVVMPTRRWYMLCGRADSPEVTERMFRAKQRPVSRTLLLAAPDVDGVAAVCRLTVAADVLAAAFWPGDLSLALPWRGPEVAATLSAVGEAAALVTVPGGTLGELARYCATPVAVTSANVSPGPGTPGSPPALSVREVDGFVHASGARVAVVVDGGVCPSPGDTTIVDCTGPNPVLRREGAVHVRAVRVALAESGLTRPLIDERPPPAVGSAAASSPPSARPPRTPPVA